MTRPFFLRWQQPLQQNPPPISKIPLCLMLTVPFVLLTIGTTGLVGYFCMRNGQQAVLDLAQQLMTETGDRVNLYLSNYLETPQLVNRLNANAARLGQIQLTESESFQRHFLQQIQTFDSLSRIHFSNPQGGYVSVAHDKRGLAVATTQNFVKGTLRVDDVDLQGNPRKLLVEQPNYDASQRPFYQRAVAVGNPTWTPVYVDVPDSSGLEISASYPLYDGRQQLQGVFSSDLTLSAIDQFLENLRVGKNGTVFIVDRAGLVIASSTARHPFVTSADRHQTKQLKAIESPELPIRLSTQYLLAQFGDLSQIKTIQQLQFNQTGERQFLQVTPFEDGFGLDWLIVVTVPEADFMKRINANTSNTIMLSAAALSGAIVLGLLLARWIAQPIQRLSRASQALATGVWQESLREDSPIAELQVLAQSFNQTASQLQQAFDRVQSALQESQEKFTTVFRTCPDPIGIFTLDGQIVEVNDAFVELFGYSSDELIGNKTRKIGNWFSLKQQQSYLQSLKAGERIHNQEYTVSKKSGELLTVLLSTERIDLQGQPCCLGIAKDITDRKQTQEALRQSEARFQKIAAASPAQIYILVCDANGFNPRFEYISSGVQEIQELEPEQVLQDATLTYFQVHPDDRAFYNAITYRALQTLEPFSYEWRIITPSGKVKWVQANSRPERRDNGDIAWYGVLLDITKRKRAEAALLDSETRFRSAFSDAPIGMALIGLNDRWIKINPRLCDMLGYSEAELLSMPVSDLVHSDDANNWQQCIQQVWSTEHHNAQVELRYACQPGHLVWGLLSLSLVRDAQNQPLYYVAHIQDITERQAIDRMKQEFISIVSHELRTPLTAIRGFLGLLDTGLYDNKPDRAKHMIAQARSNSDRLVRLVNDILDLERLSSGRVQLVMDVCNAAELVQRAAAGVQSITEQAIVTLEIHATTVQVWADADAMIQTLTNLLSNAIKFSPPHSVVTLAVQPQADSVLFSVADQGRGIPAEKLETIFGRFQQVDVSDARQKGGTGLGLAICQSIVQQHGGNIWAESTFGSGSTFYFTLPVPPKRAYD